jgi:L-ascorbate metabolism protein UlaG (beta-lactamase superfamily)
MEIRFLGHAAFEFTDGSTSILIDPFLTGNPKAAVAAEELSPQAILLTHGHGDHLGDTVSIAKRSGAEVVAIVEIANELSAEGVEHVHDPNNGEARLGFGQAGARLAHVDDAERDREHARRHDRELRRQDDLPPR